VTKYSERAVLHGAATLAAIERLVERRGVPPTVRELADELKVPRSTAYQWMLRLKAEGRITWEDGQLRTLRLVASE
jgi:Mn-dependent DtxR family transcriptional regulator